MAEAAEEQRLLRVQKSYIELEMRKFKRKKICSLHDLENQLLRDVSFGLPKHLKCLQHVFHFPGAEQEAAAAGASSLNAFTSSREDSRPRVSPTEKCPRFKRRSGMEPRVAPPSS